MEHKKNYDIINELNKNICFNMKFNKRVKKFINKCDKDLIQQRLYNFSYIKYTINNRDYNKIFKSLDFFFESNIFIIDLSNIFYKIKSYSFMRKDFINIYTTDDNIILIEIILHKINLSLFQKIPDFVFKYLLNIVSSSSVNKFILLNILNKYNNSIESSFNNHFYDKIIFKLKKIFIFLSKYYKHVYILFNNYDDIIVKFIENITEIYNKYKLRSIFYIKNTHIKFRANDYYDIKIMIKQNDIYDNEFKITVNSNFIYSNNVNNYKIVDKLLYCFIYFCVI